MALAALKAVILTLLVLVVLSSPSFTVAASVSLRSRLCPSGYVPLTTYMGSVQTVECYPRGAIVVQPYPQFDTHKRDQRFSRYDRFTAPVRVYP